MNFNDEQNYIINLKLMKITGFYQLISPYTPKYFGFNIYKAGATVEVISGIISILLLCSSSYYYLDNTNELMNHFMLVVAIFFSTFKIFWISRNSEKIWNNLDMTSFNFLLYTRHKKEILQIARAKSISTTILFVVLWSSVTIAWCISPFFVKDVYLNVKFNDNIRRFRYNSLNYVYPINEESYNEHFLYFYIVEMLQVVFWGHGTVAYDTFVISICISIAFQLKGIAVSYINLNYIKGDIKNLKPNDLEAIFNLKLLIQDQQNMFKKIKEIYKIFQPVTFVQLAAQSMLIILQAYMIFINHFNGFSLLSVPIIKLTVTIAPNIIHLFITCYLYSNINDQKDTMNFALYSSNWTAMSIKYKNILLLTMQMNDAEKLKLRISLTKIVNLEMFASVMHLTYSIISVLAKSYGNTRTK
ncbi:putative odorant receptor 92a [Melanaphis sacchari]|uniref:putative odorant receptor 92a n=1 Tax=Melanaphis sacchari TaxID=742174 RepID=UPI000DC14B6F|nr:putative odorant receptor 92a [Melanaphis sacchari]